MSEAQGQQAGQQQGIQIPMQNVLKAIEAQRNTALSDLAMAHGTVEYLQQQIQVLKTEIVKLRAKEAA